VEVNMTNRIDLAVLERLGSSPEAAATLAASSLVLGLTGDSRVEVDLPDSQVDRVVEELEQIGLAATEGGARGCFVLERRASGSVGWTLVTLAVHDPDQPDPAR
jgi:hypothetical protein